MQFSLAVLFSLAGPCHHAVQAFLPNPEALGFAIRLPGMEPFSMGPFGISPLGSRAPLLKIFAQKTGHQDLHWRIPPDALNFELLVKSRRNGYV